KAGIVYDARRQAPSGAAPRASEITVVGAGPDPVVDAEADAALGVQVQRGGDICHRLGGAAIGMGPAVERGADEQAAAGGPPQLHEPGDAALPGHAPTAVARDLGRPVAQPEPDPETVTPLRVLRACRGRRGA